MKCRGARVFPLLVVLLFSPHYIINQFQILDNPIAIDDQQPYSTISATSNNKSSDINERISRLNLTFIENIGQLANKDVKYFTDTFGGSVFVLENGTLTYVLANDNSENEERKGRSHIVDNRSSPLVASGWTFKEVFLTENDLNPAGLEKSDSTINSFVGEKESWRSNIPSYDRIKLSGVWPGIDVDLKSTGNNFEKIFTVMPEADINEIVVSFDGISHLSVSASEQLVLETVHGNISMTRPTAYQEIDGSNKYVDVSYRIKNTSTPTYGFEIDDLASYNPSYPLIIDPLLASTFIGGTNEEILNAIAVDDIGNIYVVGYTASVDYPVSVGAFDETDHPTQDVFVSKFDSELSNLLASTYLGGNGSDFGFAVTVVSDEVVLSGDTSSTDFPTTIDAYDTSFSGGTTDIFVTKLNDDLDELLASTYLGGSDADSGAFSLAVNSLGEIIVAGDTLSTDFPTTTGALDETDNGLRDIFISKLDSELDLLASTYLGGSDADTGIALALDSAENVFVTGYSSSTDFPTTIDAYDTNGSGDSTDVIVSKLSSALDQLIASTYIAGSSDDFAEFIALDSNDNVFITGEVGSDDYPTSVGAFDDTHNGGASDIFVSKLDGDLEGLSASTYIGGSGEDVAFAILVDSLDSFVYVGGFGFDGYPANVDYNGGIDDGIISKLDAASLSTLEASMFLGGDDDDYITIMTMDPSGDSLYVAGVTSSSNFPATSEAYDVELDGTKDGFISQLTTGLEARPTGSVMINADDTYTSTADVTLTLSCSDDSECLEMKISVDGEFDDETFESVETEQEVTLPDGDGIKTVHVLFKDDSGNESEEISDTIILDTTAPPAPIITFPEEDDFLTFSPDIEGTVSTNFLIQWGSAGSGDGEFDNPNDVAVDSEGNVYVVDTGNDRIQKFDGEGNFLLEWGSPLSEGFEDGEFGQAVGIAVDPDDSIYVSDNQRNDIQKFSSAGEFITKWGDEGDFSNPQGVGVDNLGYIYVADRGNKLIQKFDSDGNFVTEWGTEASIDSEFDPLDVDAGPDGSVYVVDVGNDRIQQFTDIGVFLNTWGENGFQDGEFFFPTGVATDITGNVYVADELNNRIQKFDSEGNFLTKWGEFGSAAGELDDPHRVAVDPLGNIYVLDRSDDFVPRVSIFEANNGDPVIEVYDGDDLIGAVDEPPLAGFWFMTPSPELSQTVHNVKARVIDAAGNTSPMSDIVTFEIEDDTPPDPPVITSPEDGTSTGDRTPTITGTAEADSTVAVFDDDIEIGTTEASSEGDWSFTPEADLSIGIHPITATATDGSANTSPLSSAVEITIIEGSITIIAEDTDGELLPGATFGIFPDPFTGEEAELEVQDNDGLDSSEEAGIIILEDVIFETYTVEPTIAPDGYVSLIDESTVTVHDTDPDPTTSFPFRLEADSVEDPTEVQGPGLSDEQFDTFVDNGASVDGEEVDSTDDLPPAFLVPDDQRDDIGEDKPVDPATVTFEEPAPPDSTADELFDNYDIPTYPGPQEDISDNIIYAVPSFVIPQEGFDQNSFVLTPIIDQLFAGTGLVLTQDQLTDSGNAQLVQVELELAEEGNDIGFSFGITDTLPEGFDDPPDLDVVPLFLDIDFVGDTDFSNPDAFTESPAVTILAKRLLETDDDDPVRRFPGGCPELRLYLLNEDTDEWERLDNPERFEDIDTDDMCGYIVNTDHFSKFGIGGVKGGIISGDSPVGNSGGGGGGGGAVVNIKRAVTFDQAHFEVSPLTRMEISKMEYLDSNGNLIISQANNGGNITISSTITNRQKTAQSYTFIIQIVDSDRYVINIDWSTDTLTSGQTTTISKSWQAENAGVYRIQTLIWSSLAAPDPLSHQSLKAIRFVN